MTCRVVRWVAMSGAAVGPPTAVPAPTPRENPMTLFGLVRHGQTEYNRLGLFQGSSDVPLNETGREQAHVALDTLTPIAWDLALSSTLSRAAETAQIIAEDHGIPVGTPEPRLVEIDWGAAEGNPVEEMEERYPGRTFPGRETTQSVIDRAAAALAALADAHPGARLLLVAHGTLIRLLLSGVTGEHLPSIPNGTLSLVEVEGETWRVRMIAGEEVDLPAREVPRSATPRFSLEDHHLRPQGLEPARD